MMDWVADVSGGEPPSGATAAAAAAADGCDDASSSEAGSEFDDDGEDTACDVCRDGTWHDDNPILLCDGGCRRGTHLTCYGVLSVPEGDWQCGTCAARYTGPCVACGLRGGMMRRSTAAAAGGGTSSSSGGGWIHVLCALTVEGVAIENTTLMEPITVRDTRGWDGGKRAPVCAGCDVRRGAKLRCAAPGCVTLMHPGCAADAGSRIELRATAAKAPFYCEAHEAATRRSTRTDGFEEEDVVGLLDGMGVCNRSAWAARVSGGGEGGGSGEGDGSASTSGTRWDAAAPVVPPRLEVNAATAGKMPHSLGYHVRRAIHPDDLREAAEASDRVVAAPTGTAFSRMGDTVRAIMAALGAAQARQAAAVAALRSVVAQDNLGAVPPAARAALQQTAAASAATAAASWEETLLGSPHLFGRAADYWKGVLPRWWCPLPCQPPDVPLQPLLPPHQPPALPNAGLTARFSLGVPADTAERVPLPPALPRHRWDYGAAATLLRFYPVAAAPARNRRRSHALAGGVDAATAGGGFNVLLVEADEAEEDACGPLLEYAAARGSESSGGGNSGGAAAAFFASRSFTGINNAPLDDDECTAAAEVAAEADVLMPDAAVHGVARLWHGTAPSVLGGDSEVDAELAMTARALAAVRVRNALRAAQAAAAHRSALVYEAAAARREVELLTWLKAHALLNGPCDAPRPCAMRGGPCPHRVTIFAQLAAAVAKVCAAAPPPVGGAGGGGAGVDMLGTAPPRTPAATMALVAARVTRDALFCNPAVSAARMEGFIAVGVHAALSSSAEWGRRWDNAATASHALALPFPVAAAVAALLRVRLAALRPPMPRSLPPPPAGGLPPGLHGRIGVSNGVRGGGAGLPPSAAEGVRAAWMARRAAWLQHARGAALSAAVASLRVALPATSSQAPPPADPPPSAAVVAFEGSGGGVAGDTVTVAPLQVAGVGAAAPPAARLLAALAASCVMTTRGGQPICALVGGTPPAAPAAPDASGVQSSRGQQRHAALIDALGLTPQAGSVIPTMTEAADAVDAVLGCMAYLVRRVEAGEADDRAAGAAEAAAAAAVGTKRPRPAAGPTLLPNARVGGGGGGGGGAASTTPPPPGGADSSSALPAWLSHAAAMAFAAMPPPPFASLDAVSAAAALSDCVDALFTMLRRVRARSHPTTADDVAQRLVDERLAALPTLSRTPAYDADGAELFCVCNTPHDASRVYVGCDACGSWFHLSCVGVSVQQAKYAILSYACAACFAALGRRSYVRAARDPTWQDARAALAAVTPAPPAVVAAYVCGALPPGTYEEVPWRTDSSAYAAYTAWQEGAPDAATPAACAAPVPDSTTPGGGAGGCAQLPPGWDGEDDGSSRIPDGWWQANRRITLRPLPPLPGAPPGPPRFTWLPRP